MSNPITPSPLRTIEWTPPTSALTRHTPPQFPAKLEGDRLDYTADFTQFLSDINDTIVSVTVTSSPADLTITAWATGTSSQTVWIEGGLSQTAYLIDFNLITAGGRDLNAEFSLSIVDEVPDLILVPDNIVDTEDDNFIATEDGNFLAF